MKTNVSLMFWRILFNFNFDLTTRQYCLKIIIKCEDRIIYFVQEDAIYRCFRNTHVSMLGFLSTYRQGYASLFTEFAFWFYFAIVIKHTPADKQTGNLTYCCVCCGSTLYKIKFYSKCILKLSNALTTFINS